MSILNIASWGFLLGAGGQVAFFWKLFPHVPPWLAAAVVFIPWFTVFGVSFCNQPPCGPRRFRQCLLFALSWYWAMSGIAELLHALLDAAPSRHLPIWAARALMYGFGSITTAVLLRACATLRKLELQHPPSPR